MPRSTGRSPRRGLDPAAVARAIQTQRETLETAGIPADPETFPAGDQLSELIALVAFGLRHEIAAAPTALRVVVRTLADRLATAQPGRSVEVRIPPFAAVQCVSGPRHTRGTPPNVVETDPTTFVGLACGFVDWDEAVADGRVRASGERADLRAFLPLDVLRS